MWKRCNIWWENKGRILNSEKESCSINVEVYENVEVHDNVDEYITAARRNRRIGKHPGTKIKYFKLILQFLVKILSMIRCLSAQAFVEDVPRLFEDNRVDKRSWKLTIIEEVKSQDDHRTWKLVQNQDGMKITL